MDEKLPQIQMPGGFPAWLIAGHSSTDDDVYSSVEMAAGHRRMRRVFATAPQVRRVSLFLTQAQAQEFFNWFELDIDGGSERFAAKVRTLGEGHLWYGAVFRSSPPYTAELNHHGRPEVYWRISAELTLYGTGSEYGPQLTSFEARASVPLVASARATPGFTAIRAEVAVPLVSVVGHGAMAAEVSVPLLAVVEESLFTPLYASVDIELRGTAAATRTTFFAANVEVPLNGRVG